jgi:V/A-type H+-transporting ATPase subunit C
MNDQIFSAVAAKARAFHGKMITQEEYSEMLRKNSIQSVIAFLKTTKRYENEFSAINELTAHRGQIEELLAKSVFEVFIRLYRFIPSNDEMNFRSFMLRKAELDTLTDVILFIKIGKPESIIIYLPAYLRDQLSFDVMELGGVKDYTDLLRALQFTRYNKLLTPFLQGTAPNAEAAIMALNTDYYTRLLGDAQKDLPGKVGTEMRKVILTQIEMANLMTVYRMRSLFNESAASIRPRLLPFYGKIKARQFEELLAGSSTKTATLEIFEKRYFKGHIPVDEGHIENSVSRYFLRFFRTQMVMTTSGTMSMYALMNLLEYERMNVTRIIEGKRYGLPPHEIEKLLMTDLVKPKSA